MKHIKKIALSAVSLLAIATGVYAYTELGVEKTNANPDFICVKSVDSQPCNVTSYSAWRTDGTRIGYGTKVNQVFYRLTRTTCEAGYAQYATGAQVGGDSGRRTPDMTYSTSSCTVVQTDHTAPVGAGG